MKIAYEVPIAHFYDVMGNYHFALAHLIKNNLTYKGFFRIVNLDLMLDNGVFETGEPLLLTELLRIARDIRAYTIVLPDYPMDFNRSFQKLIYCLKETTLDSQTIINFNWMIVPQAKPQSWIDAYIATTQVALQRIPRNQLIIGMPVWLDGATSSRNRARLISEMVREKIWLTGVKHHLLGIDHLSDIFPVIKYFNSIDTSFPFTAAIYESQSEEPILSPHRSYPRPPDYFNSKYPPQIVSLAQTFAEQLEGILNEH